jgi:hypothetical protein
MSEADRMNRRMRLYAKMIDPQVNTQRTRFYRLPEAHLTHYAVSNSVYANAISFQIHKWVFNGRDETTFVIRGAYVKEVDTFFFSKFDRLESETLPGYKEDYKFVN